VLVVVVVTLLADLLLRTGLFLLTALLWPPGLVLRANLIVEKVCVRKSDLHSRDKEIRTSSSLDFSSPLRWRAGLFLRAGLIVEKVCV
jgi:hypothetical protein